MTMLSTTAAPAVRAERAHPARWTTYAIEGALLGLFMISACAFTVLLEHPTLGGPALFPSPLIRRAIVGVAMGLTAVALIYSPWGRRSGAHLNPAVTVSFLRLRMISGRDAIGFVGGQFVGGIAGVAVCAAVARRWLVHPAVAFAATTPGRQGPTAAWVGEFAIAFAMMTTVLASNRRARLKAYTGYLAACLVALCITFEAPLSGMSLNPARTFASAVWAWVWTGWWVYFTAPVAGMLAAVETQRWIVGHPHHLCPRLHHCPKISGIFRCNCGHSGSIQSTQTSKTRAPCRN